MQPWLESKTRGMWERRSSWVRRHQAIARLVILTIGLVVFLVVVPVSLRTFFWEGLQANKILTGMLLVFSLLAISLIWSTGQQLDAWAFLFLNIRGPRPLWLDRIMTGLTQAGSAVTALGIALLLYLTGSRLLAYEIIFGTLTLWLVVEVVKFFIHRSRPAIRLAQARIVGHRHTGRSFPSGHTSQIFFMATLLAQHYQLSLWAVLLVYGVALLVGITRIYVGAHYPRDVFAGAILGSAWGLIGIFSIERLMITWLISS